MEEVAGDWKKAIPQILPEAISTCMKNKKEEQAWSYRGQIVPDLTGCLCYDDMTDPVNKWRIVGVVYLGFSKTFDMVSHSTLVVKLRRHGLGGRSTNELTDRSHQV